MNGNAYRLLGFAVWNAGKWYLRRRFGPSRSLVLKGLMGAGALGALAVVAKRATA